MASTTWLGPLGDLRELRMPPPLPAPLERAVSTAVTVAGVAKVQRAPAGPRRLTWDFTWADPGEIRELVALEQGVHGVGPWWWYDPMAAGLQMLPAGAASPGLGGVDLFDTSGTATLDVASAVPWSIGVTGSGEAEAPTVPVIVGRAYVGAAQVSADARVGLRWVDSAEATLSTDYGATGTTRRTVAATAPAGAAGVRLVLDPTSTMSEVDFSELQVVEATAAVDWEPGPGMARWSIVNGLGTFYQLADRDAADYRRDLTVTLVEVG